MLEALTAVRDPEVLASLRVNALDSLTEMVCYGSAQAMPTGRAGLPEEKSLDGSDVLVEELVAAVRARAEAPVGE